LGFYNTVAFADVDPERMNNANALLSTLQELGTGLGVAVGALLVRVGEPLAVSFGLGDAAAPQFRIAFVVLAALPAAPGRRRAAPRTDRRQRRHRPSLIALAPNHRVRLAGVSFRESWLMRS
jgi:hypothetical protein